VARCCILNGRNCCIFIDRLHLSKRVIAAPASALSVLREYRKEWLEDRLMVGDVWQGSERLFVTWDGRPMYPDTMSQWFANFLSRSGLPPLTFHGLRHTSATLLISQGAPLKNVSSRLGHSNISTTANVYAHALKSVDKEIAEKLDDLLTGKRP
jgi:integrase